MDSTLHEREEELYRLWEEVAGPGRAFVDIGGRRITVVSRGVRNRGSGPDFLDAVLLVDGELRVGPVEMHRREEEWFLHGHDRDPAFDRVILHVLGLAPSRPRLAMPTVDRAGLVAPNEPTAAAVVEPPASEPSAALLAALSWERFLRRATILLREEPEGAVERRISSGFLRRLYDALGYMDNREPMAVTAARLLEGDRIREGEGLEEVAVEVLRASGLEPERFLAPALAALGEARLAPLAARIAERLDERIAERAGDGSETPEAGASPAWKSGGRPGNDPARRLWGAVLLTHSLLAHGGLERLFEVIVSGARFEALIPPLTAGLAGQAVVGRQRGAEIALNALLPTALAAGILRGNPQLAGRACEIYRWAPALGSNRIIRLIEARYLRNDRLDGAFWQQGAIEFHQRYLSPDRTRLSFIAEIDGRGQTPPPGSTST